MLTVGLKLGWVLGATCAGFFPAQRDVLARWVLIPANHKSGQVVPVEGDWALPCAAPTFLGKGKSAALLRPLGHPVLIVPQKIAAEDLPQEACSIEAWAAVDVYTGWGGFFSALEDNGNAETGLMLGTRNDQFAFGVSSEGADDGDGKMKYLESKEPFELGRWYHVVGTYDGVTQRIYVDGKLQGQSLEQHGAIKYLPEHTVAVGGYVDSNESYPLTGALHEVSLHDVCLSGKTIQRRYRKLRGSLPVGEGRTFTVVPLREKMPLPEMQTGINLAIDRGVQNLLREQLWDGSWEQQANPYRNGPTGLALYTLLRCGLKADHPAVVMAIQFLKAAPPTRVYSAGCQLLALGATGDPAHRAWAEELVSLLLEWENNARPGSWGYPSDNADLSCTQYAALGFWGAAQLGVEIDIKVWRRMIERVMKSQPSVVEVPWFQIEGEQRSGKRRIAGFTYHEGGEQRDATGTMTTAGLCVLQIPNMLEGRKLGATAMRAVDAGRVLGMAWLAHYYPMDGHPRVGNNLYYYLYGLERVGAYMAVNEIGGNPWYQDGAMTILKRQKGQGAWGSTSDTSFALLFLRRASAATQTGDAVERTVKAYSDDQADVFLYATGDAQMTMWLEGFSGERRDLYQGADRSWEGLRVDQVIYLVDDKEIARVKGNKRVPWAYERFAVRQAIIKPGPHTLQAHVLLVPPNGDPEVGSQTDTIKSGVLDIVTVDMPEEWMAGNLEVQGVNLEVQGVNLLE
ncbi:MAG: LamG-like jellyroll fold domain-containing protein, partial [bacterium]